MKIREIIVESIDPTDKDLQSVSEWMNTTTENLLVDVVFEPIEKFIKQIQEMYDTYDEYPKDLRRTKKIITALLAGEKPLPIYVAASDPHLFVMEGRHRMVAFWKVGMKIIPVAYVSVKTGELTEDRASILARIREINPDWPLEQMYDAFNKLAEHPEMTVEWKDKISELFIRTTHLMKDNVWHEKGIQFDQDRNSLMQEYVDMLEKIDTYYTTRNEHGRYDS